MEIAILICCLIPGIYLAYKDWKEGILPDYITIPILLLGLFFSIFIFNNFTTGFWGFIFGFGLMFLLTLRGGVGGGDIKLAGALGIWFGFININYIILIAAFLGLIYGSYKLARKGKWLEHFKPFFMSAKYKLLYDRAGKLHLEPLPAEGIAADNVVPFGTFLVIGAWIWYLFLLI